MSDKGKKRDEITGAVMQQPSFGERLTKGLSGMFLNTPYPEQERPTDPDAWMRAAQEKADADEKERAKRGYGFPR